MSVTRLQICNCYDTGGSSPRNEKGLITHGDCRKIRRTVVFICANCLELSASSKVDYVRNDSDHVYHCDDCQELLELDAIECTKKRCHNYATELCLN